MEEIKIANILTVIKAEPYSDESALTGLKFTLTALEHGHELSIFLVQGGIFCALKNQNPSQISNHYDMVDKIIESGGRIVCCGTCMKSRGVSSDQLHTSTEVGSMSIFVELAVNANNIMNF